MSHNITPRPFSALLSFAKTIHNGVAENADRLTLRQHDAESVAADVEHFQTSIVDYQFRRAEHAARREELRAATALAKTWCGRTVDTLKLHLGRRWNAKWIAAGFTNGSIAIPGEFDGILLSLTTYFRLHPEHEVPALEITAAHLTAVLDSLVAAELAANLAHDAEVAAKQVRDAARKQLRRRIAAVRNELHFLLPPDDGRWYLFGFHRPADGQLPERVEEITVRPLDDDQVEVQWSPSARAQDYRVSKQVAGRDPEPVEAALVSATSLVLRDVPVGTDVVFLVSARNRAGETVPTRVEWNAPLGANPGPGSELVMGSPNRPQSEELPGANR